MRAIQSRAPTRSRKIVGRHLKQEIGDEKQSGTQSKGRLAETKRLIHMKLCETDIHAIEIGNEIA